MIYCYTDGSALGNGKKNARAGVGVWFSDNDPRNISEPLTGVVQTNNRAELTGIKRALEMLNTSKSEDITIASDSQYSINCVTKWIMKWKTSGWKTSKGKEVKNKDLIVSIDRLMGSFKHLQFMYVKAHTNKTDIHSIGNSQADKLAVQGARR